MLNLNNKLLSIEKLKKKLKNKLKSQKLKRIRIIFRSSLRRCSVRIGVLKNFPKFTWKYLCQSLFFNKVAGLRPATLLKKETLTNVFSCEFYEIFKTTYFYRTSLVAAAGLSDSTNVPTTANQFTRFYMKGKLVFFNSFMTVVPII